MRFLAAVAVILATVTGTVCAQHGASHPGNSGRAPAGMRSFGAGRASGPSGAPVNRGPYHGFGSLHATPGGRHLGYGGQHVGYGGPPNRGREPWRDREGNRDHSHHRMPYSPGYGGGYGYGVSGWYLSPYVLGYPDAFDYGSSGSYAENGGNQISNADNYGGPGPDGGPQGYGPEPGYQEPNYPDPNYPAPSYATPNYQRPNFQGSQPGRPVYPPSSPPAEIAQAIVPEVAVTLIFKDGRPPEHIYNYLLTATKLTILDAKFREIPLDQINMSATEKANRAAGIDFRTPNGTR